MVDRYIDQKFSIDCFHTAFAFSYDESFVFRGERHDFWEITLLTAGGMTVTLDEKVYSMGPGNMLFYAPMTFHREQSELCSRPAGYTISFHAAGRLPDALTKGVFKLDKQMLREYEEIVSHLITLVGSESCGEYYGQYAASRLTAFIIKLSDNEQGAPVVSSVSAQEYNKVATDMAKCTLAGFSLSEFAKRNNMSVSYLKLLFAKYAGVSPKSYYTTLRANEAAALLRSGSSVSEVAEALSFSSPNYFSLFFKRIFGVTPQKYKQRYHG